MTRWAPRATTQERPTATPVLVLLNDMYAPKVVVAPLLADATKVVAQCLVVTPTKGCRSEKSCPRQEDVVLHTWSSALKVVPTHRRESTTTVASVTIDTRTIHPQKREERAGGRSHPLMSTRPPPMAGSQTNGSMRRVPRSRASTDTAQSTRAKETPQVRACPTHHRLPAAAPPPPAG